MDCITNVNRLGLTDSNLSLDMMGPIGNSRRMTAQPSQLYAEQTDMSKNMARYYTMEIFATLFGEACLIRRWGRIGTKGRQLTNHFEKEEEAVRLFLVLLRRKSARGYRTMQGLKAPAAWS